MKKLKFLNSSAIRPKSLLLIFISLLVVMAASVFIELDQSRKETLELMVDQSRSIIETTVYASGNALRSTDKIEKELRQRLLNNANFIKILFEKKEITDKLLEQIAAENNIYRINIFNRNGKKLFTSQEEIHTGLQEKNNPVETLEPVFNGELDTLVIGVKDARFETGKRFAVAVATNLRDAVVLNLDAENLLQFRKEMGFGHLLREVVKNKNIIFSAFQNESGILAASGNVNELEMFEDSEFLEKASQDTAFHWRISSFGGNEILEAVHSLEYEGEIIGLLRIGLSLTPLENVRGQIVTRSVLIGLGFLVFGFVILSLIFMRQNFDILQNQFRAVESFSEKVLNNVADAIVVLNSGEEITTMNVSAKNLFGIDEKDRVKELNELLSDDDRGKILKTLSAIIRFDCKINGALKNLLITKSSFKDEDSSQKTILVIRDLTEQTVLEEQVKRSERLTAMGELASGVAHEIRNPLNSIGTIAQQLNKDFSPSENIEEYNNLTKIVYREVRRINETVTGFLRFASPEKIDCNEFEFSEITDQLNLQFGGELKTKQIALLIENKIRSKVNWDKNKIFQVMINLLKNAEDAAGPGGKIEIRTSEINDRAKIIVADNGPGIPDEILPKIFNLYFTTKAGGSGIGLSVIQKIIESHNGSISVRNKKESGAEFNIVLPLDAKNKKV